MELSLLSLIETTKPSRLRFNENGVLLNGYKFNSYDGRIIRILVACLNGMWAVKVDLMCQNWGSGGPITRRDFIYPTFEEALSYAWDYIQKRFENSSGTSRKESTIFYKEYSKYKDMASENYFTLFKEGNFYGFI